MRLAATLALSALAVTFAGPAAAEGKYTRRQRLRGEITDTAPKLDRFAFINDAAPDPMRLSLAVDTWIARSPQDPTLLPLVLAFFYDGDGPPLPIRPDRFELTWDGAAAPVKAISQKELIARTDGWTPVRNDLRMLSHREALPFESQVSRPISVRFHVAPQAGFVHDTLNLPARTWFATLAYFPVPEGFSTWDAPFELRYVPEDGKEPAVTCRFRVQREASLQSDAMRKARRDLERERREGRTKR